MDGVPIYSSLSNSSQHKSEDDSSFRRLDSATKLKAKDKQVNEQIQYAEHTEKEFKKTSSKTSNPKCERQNDNLVSNVNSAASLKTEDIKLTKLNIVPISSTIISANTMSNTDELHSTYIRTSELAGDELKTIPKALSETNIEENENSVSISPIIQEQKYSQSKNDKPVNVPNLNVVLENKEMASWLKTAKCIDSSNYLSDFFENSSLKSISGMDNDKAIKKQGLSEIADIETNGPQLIISKREMPLSLSSGLSPNVCVENNLTYSYSKTNQSYIHPSNQATKRDISISGFYSLNKSNCWESEVKPLSEFMNFKFEEKVISFSDNEMKLIKKIDYILACKFCYCGLNIIIMVLIIIGSSLIIILPILYGNNKLPKEIEIIHVMFFNLVVMFIMFVLNSYASREVRIDGHYAVRSYIRIYWHLFRKKIDPNFHKKYLFLDDWYGDDKYKFIESTLLDKSKIDEINKNITNDNYINNCDDGLQIV